MDSKRSLAFYQIFYKDEQKDKLYPFATPYENNTLTPYFENSVIADLVPKSNAELISVCSWRLREKRASGSAEIILKDQGTFYLTYENITERNYDIAILTPHIPSHKPLAMARNWHGKAWVEAFQVLKIFLHTHDICKVPDELSHAIYENHFIATSVLFNDYVTNCLAPVIDFMRGNGVFDADSGYLQKKRNDQQAIKDYQDKTGRQDWPIAPFILERLFSIWIEGKGYKVINL